MCRVELSCGTFVAHKRTVVNTNVTIQRVLELRNLSPHELSKRAGLSSSQVRQWIDRRSERVSLEVLRKVAAAASVSALWLITGSGSPEDDDALRDDDGASEVDARAVSDDGDGEHAPPVPSRSENRHRKNVTFAPHWYVRTQKTLRTC